MKVGFTGPDSVGKSTLIAAVRRAMESHGHRVHVISTGDIARTSPLPVVEDQTSEASAWIINAVRNAEAVAAESGDIVLADRTALDVYVFQKLSRNSADAAKLEELVRHSLAGYRAVCCAFIDPAIPVCAENLPTANYSGRDRFEYEMQAAAARWAGVTEFVLLPHNEGDRLSLVLQLLKSAQT